MSQFQLKREFYKMKIVLSWQNLSNILKQFFVYLRREFVHSECKISRDEMYIRAEYISLQIPILDTLITIFLHSQKTLQCKGLLFIFVPSRTVCLLCCAHNHINVEVYPLGPYYLIFLSYLPGHGIYQNLVLFFFLFLNRNIIVVAGS